MSDRSGIKPNFLALIVLVVCVGPSLYWAHIVSVMIHELIGHGLVALVLGGRFDGFMISHGAYGWAYAYIPTELASAEPWREALVYAGGSLSTGLTGVAVMLATHKHQATSIPVRLTACVLAYALLNEGGSYLFFTTLHPTGGDWAFFWQICGGSTTLRVAMIFVGGVWLLGALVWTLSYGLADWEKWLRAGQTEGTPAIGWIALPGVMIALPLFVFNWDFLAPGLWHWPNVTQLVLHTLLSLVIAKRLIRHGVNSPVAIPSGVWRVATFNIAVSLVLFSLCWLVLQHEVIWADWAS